MAESKLTYLTFELAEEMCNRLARGESLTSICKDDSMPELNTVYRWKREYDWFAKMYQIARTDQAHTLVDEIITIADDSTNDYMERETDRGVKVLLNDENIRRSAIRISARQWFAERIAPKLYGPKAEFALANPDGTNLIPTTIKLVAAPFTPIAPAGEGEESGEPSVLTIEHAE